MVKRYRALHAITTFLDVLFVTKFKELDCDLRDKVNPDSESVTHLPGIETFNEAAWPLLSCRRGTSYVRGGDASGFIFLIIY